MAQTNDVFAGVPQYTPPANSDWDTYIPPDNLIPPGARVILLDDGSEAVTFDEPSSLNPKSRTEEIVKLTSFDVFPELPVELQLKIWRYTACVPRIVEVKLEPCYYFGDYGELCQYCEYRRISPKPALTRTSVDAPREAISVLPASKNKVKMHINPDADCLLMTVDDLAEDYDNERPKIDFKSVGYLAIKNYELNDDMYYFDYTVRFFAKQVANYVSLKELILVDPNDNWVMDDWTSTSHSTNRGFQDGNKQRPIVGSRKTRLVQSRLANIEAELKIAMNRKGKPRGAEFALDRSVWWDAPKVTCMTEASLKARF